MTHKHFHLEPQFFLKIQSCKYSDAYEVDV